MRVLVAGAGPAGLTVAATLARRGHSVVTVDPDAGPAPDGTWRRRGVMQFDHAHGFRAQVRDLLVAEWPDAWDEWLRLGAEPVETTFPGVEEPAIAVRSQRSTYERALRAAARRVPGLGVRPGRVDGLIEGGRRVVGAVVDGTPVAADLVIDATGRGGRAIPSVTQALRQECGIAYVDRVYRRHEGTELGPLTTPIAWGGTFEGYQAIVFPHDDRFFSVVLVRPTADRALARLRHTEAFETACQAIPALAAWTHPDRARPVSDVLVGGGLHNVYRTQRGLAGLVALGDSVATTTPTAGRGVALASLQIEALLGQIDAATDPRSVSDPFGAWCDVHIRPWVEDHIATDAEATLHLEGHDIDLTQPLTSRAIVDAAARDPRIAAAIGPFLGMTALPASLAPVEPPARAVYETGWRPSLADGPTRDELVALLEPA